MNEKIVMSADQYDRIDGRNAYRSDIKRLTLGEPRLEENKNMQIAAQIWKENADGKLEVYVELPIHQVLDLMIFLSRTLLYFGEAYRLPLLYQPEKPVVQRLGVQGGVMPISICTDNPNINEDIKKFSQAISDLGELTGDRLRVLAHILEEMECY
jgi:single-stranded DNA-specific DHH superfamily exonuclease